MSMKKTATALLVNLILLVSYQVQSLSQVSSGSQSKMSALVRQGYEAYTDRELRKARKLFSKFLEKISTPQTVDVFRARLGLARIYILSPDLKNTSEGRKHLEYIIDKGIIKSGSGESPDQVREVADLRSQAIFLLARSYHLERTVNKTKKEDAFRYARRYYRQYLDEYPAGKLKSRVILYLAQTYLRGTEDEDVDKAITLLEDFVNSPEGRQDEYYAALTYCLGQVYHLRKNDLETSVRYLNMALEKGIADYTIHSDTLYKIATIYDKLLGKPEKALGYYKKLVDQFPVSSRVNVIRKRIEEIESGHE